MSFLIFNLFFSMASYSLAVLTYEITKNPIIVSIQVASIALGSTLACTLMKKTTFRPNDKENIILIDFILLLVIIFSFISYINLSNSLSAFVFIVTSLIISLITALRVGYQESLISYISSKNNLNRQNLIGLVKIYSNIGSIIGFSLISLIVFKNNYFLLFSTMIATLLLSIYTIHLIDDGGVNYHNKKDKKISLMILFNEKIKWLSLSHAIASFSLYVYNGTFLFILKDIYGISNLLVSIYFISMMVCSLAGSFLITKITKKIIFLDHWSIYLRLSYSTVFLIIALSNSIYMFILSTLLLNLVHSFSIPIWQNMFQKSAITKIEWRVIATTRKALVSLVGILGSSFGGLIIYHWKYQVSYIVSFFVSLLSVYFLVKHVKRSENGQF